MPTDTTAVGALVAALAKKKPIAKLLRGGAAPSALAELDAMGAPAGVRALLAAHDGSTDELLGPHRLLSVAEIVETRATMTGLAATERWPADRWKAAWIPLFGDGDGQLLALDPVGGTDDGPAGQIVAYDHEAGPARELASLDVLFDLLTTLAKKGLLGPGASEDEAFEAAYAKAQAVGLTKMPPKELKKLLAAIDAFTGPAEDALAMVLPAAKKYGAEQRLWMHVMELAGRLSRRELAVRAAERAVRLTPARDRPMCEPALALALHRAGRDDEALAVLRAAFGLKTNYPKSLVPLDAAPAFVHRAFVVGTEVRPKSHELWLERGRHATDRAERAAAFRAAIALTNDAELVKFNEGIATKVRDEAARLDALDEADALEGTARLDALVALSKRETEAENQDTWLRVARAATELGAWAVAEHAGERAIATAQLEYQRYQVASWRVRALAELGREDEAVALVDEVLRAMMFDQERAAALVAIPDGLSPALRARVFAVAAPALDENAHAWLGLARTTSDPGARAAALARVLALTTDDALAAAGPIEGSPPEWNAARARHVEALREARRDARAMG
jgi:tetratricopeptide (TPR) repeat protein